MAANRIEGQCLSLKFEGLDPARDVPAIRGMLSGKQGQDGVQNQRCWPGSDRHVFF